LTVRFRWFCAKSLSVRRGDWDYYVYRVGGIDNVSIVDFDPEVPEVIRANSSMPIPVVAQAHSTSLTAAHHTTANLGSPV
jgi:hypothetical protein